MLERNEIEMAEPAPARILVVEDEPKVAEALGAGLRDAGFAIDVAHDGEEGFFLAASESFDAIVLDRVLPGRDGLSILAALRRKGVLVPVLVLTALDGVDERVAGLEAGADDYLAKPFAFPELVARLKALLRRGRGDNLLQLAVADLRIAVARREVTRADRLIELTPREYELLEYLVRHRGQIVSREMLARDVWKETQRGTPLDNVIDVHVTRLRKKIDQGFEPRLIHTVRGVGFLLGPQGDGA
jgi:DNA-binding response OmpR family regulator